MIFPFPSSPKNPPTTIVEDIIESLILVYFKIENCNTINNQIYPWIILAEPNYAGNIIVNLASLPDFLRKPILKKRMSEFFSMDQAEKDVVINNALEAGPTIPFPNFSKLFKTWLEILAVFSEEQRTLLFSSYVEQVSKNPQKLISFNLDGILEIYLSLKEEEKAIISKSVNQIINRLDTESKRRILLIIPQKAKTLFGL